MGTHSEAKNSRTNALGGDTTVQVTFRIDPPSSCLLNSIDNRVGHIRLHRSEDSVNCDMVIEDAEDREWAVIQGRHSMEPDCPCAVFSEYDVVPHVTNVSDRSFDVTLFAPDPDTARAVFEGLKSQSRAVTLLRFIPLSDWNYRPWCTIDLSVLTPKQRRSLRMAFDAGYYDDPRGVTLEALANEIGVSTSAFASRLRNAERNLLEQVFGDQLPVPAERP